MNIKERLYKPVWGGVFFAAFIAAEIYTKNRYEGTADIIAQLAVIAILAASVFFMFGIKKPEAEKEVGKAFTKTAAVTMGIFTVIIPLTVIICMYLFKERKYYITCALVLAEALIPYFIISEKHMKSTHKLAAVSVFCALAVAGRMAFYALPQFKPMAAVVIIAGITLGGETGFLCGALSMFLSNLYFGQGPWTPWQMLAFGALGALAGVLVSTGVLPKKRLPVMIFGAAAVFLLYGFILNTSTVLMYYDNPTPGMFLTSYIMGMPFDLVHAVSTAFFLWFAAEPMIGKLERIKIKYEI